MHKTSIVSTLGPASASRNVISQLIAMGGIAPTEESLGKWFAAGAACVGMSSKLFPKTLLEIGDFDQSREIIRRTLEIIAKVRGNKDI